MEGILFKETYQMSYHEFRVPLLIHHNKMITKKKPGWDDKKIIEELTNIKSKIGHFPTQNELRDLGRQDLNGAINRHDGIVKFRKLFGDDLLRKPPGYWSDETIIKDVSKIKTEIGHFPTTIELNDMGRSDLGVAMTIHGGTNKFRILLNDEILQVSRGFWNDDTIIKDLSEIKKKIGHFPSQQELSNLKRCDLSNQISIHGGINKFREIIGDELLKVSNGYWTDDTIIKQLTDVKNKISHFPTHTELLALGRTDLSSQISKHGGYNRFRKILGDKIIQVSQGYWSDEIIVSDLIKIKNKLKHFPTYQEIINLGHFDLANAINKQGGINKFRLLLGDKILKQPDGYWTEETIIKELKDIIGEIGHFPSNQELIDLCRFDLTHAIQRNDGFNNFRGLLGETISLYEKYRSELASYLVKRGKDSENIVRSISQDYCKQNSYPEPKYNIKLSRGHIIEFVCNTGKTIGIDVTNTESKYAVSKKWTRKSYHLHLDELWIVVFGTFSNDDYTKWNHKSPHNVKVFSIYGFLGELDYSINESLKNKIDRYCSCTFHTKDELKNIDNLIYK